MTATPARSLRVRLVRPTLPELWLFLAVGLPAIASLVATLPTVDLAYQLRAGADILAGRGIPSVDTWTFTAAGQPWLDQPWGAQAILAAVYAAAGWSGLAVLRAALVALVFGLVLVAIRRRSPAIDQRRAAWLALAAFIVAAPALALRPQLLGMVCFAAALVLLAGRADRPRLAWLLPVVAALWANLHGSFILAPALVGLAWLEDLEARSGRARATFLLGVATLAATIVTPFGLDTWRYAAGLAANPEVTSRITEWQPTTPTDVTGILFWASVALAAAALLVMYRQRRGVSWSAVVTLVAFAGLGAMAVRGVAWWPLIAAVTLAGLLAPPAPTRAEAPGAAAPPAVGRTPPAAGRASGRGNPVNAAVALVLGLSAIVALPLWRPVDPGTLAPDRLLGHAPSAITAALRDHATAADRVWNAQVWGSWLEFAVPAPAYAFDSRIEVIPAEAWADGDRVTAVEPGWDAILDARGVTIVAADGGPASRLATALANHRGWRLVASEPAGTLWFRADR